MRVFIVNPFDNLPGEGFRPGRYELLSRALAEAGHEVTWFSADFSHARKCRRAIGAPEGFTLRLLAVPAYRANVSLARILSHRAFARAFARAAAAEGTAPDLVIASAPPLGSAAAALRFARHHGAKFVLDVQDAWPETFYRLLPRPVRGLGRILFAPLHARARRLYREADLVTGTCDRYAKLVTAAGAKSYRRFYLGIDLSHDAGASRPLENAPLSVAYVGNLGRGYDLKTVIAAVEGMENATLEVAGAHAPSKEGKVTYHGYLAAADLQAMLRRCAVGVVPMTEESFVGIPNKVADYAAAGLGIASTLRGECAALLERTRAGVTVAPGDVAALRAAIREAADRRDNSAALKAELDAARIYPDFLQACQALTSSRSGQERR